MALTEEAIGFAARREFAQRNGPEIALRFDNSHSTLRVEKSRLGEPCDDELIFRFCSRPSTEPADDYLARSTFSLLASGKKLAQPGQLYA